MRYSDIRKYLENFLETASEKLRRHLEREVLRAEIRKERRQLLELDEHLLRDIGKTRDQVLREAARSDQEILEQRLGKRVKTGSSLLTGAVPSGSNLKQCTSC